MRDDGGGRRGAGERGYDAADVQGGVNFRKEGRFFRAVGGAGIGIGIGFGIGVGVGVGVGVGIGVSGEVEDQGAAGATTTITTRAPRGRFKGLGGGDFQ